MVIHLYSRLSLPRHSLVLAEQLRHRVGRKIAFYLCNCRGWWPTIQKQLCVIGSGAVGVVLVGWPYNHLGLEGWFRSEEKMSLGIICQAGLDGIIWEPCSVKHIAAEYTPSNFSLVPRKCHQSVRQTDRFPHGRIWNGGLHWFMATLSLPRGNPTIPRWLTSTLDIKLGHKCDLCNWWNWLLFFFASEQISCSNQYVWNVSEKETGLHLIIGNELDW